MLGLALHRLRGTEGSTATVRFRRTARRVNPATIAGFVAELSSRSGRGAWAAPQRRATAVADLVARGEAQFLLYQAEDGRTRIEVRFDGETAWLSIVQMAELFQRDRSVILRHIGNVFDEGELDRTATCARSAQVQREGDREVKREIELYSLDVIICSGPARSIGSDEGVDRIRRCAHAPWRYQPSTGWFITWAFAWRAYHKAGLSPFRDHAVVSISNGRRCRGISSKVALRIAARLPRANAGPGASRRIRCAVARSPRSQRRSEAGPGAARPRESGSDRTVVTEGTIADS
jgi:hypothetical protein